MLQLAHAGTGGFTRDFTVETGSNRLQRMTIGTTPYDYGFDANGNLTAETTSRHFEWNHADQMKSFATQTAGAEPSIHAQYLYDAAGQRVKKLVRSQGGAVEVTHYIDGIFEHHRWQPGPGRAGGENNHVHVMDDRQRVALVRVGAAHPDDRGPASAIPARRPPRQQQRGRRRDRHPDQPRGIHPIWRDQLRQLHAKRYRFTGKERDEESGLSYHGARYYSPWLGRWQSADPAAGWPLVNSYDYCFSNPLQFSDPNGAEPSGSMFARWDTDRSGKLDADEVLDGIESTTVKAGIDFLSSPGPARFTKAGELVRNAILAGHFAEESAAEARFEEQDRRQPRMWEDGSISTREERQAYLFRLDFYGGADVRNGLLFGALYYAATGDQNGARMLNGLAGGLGGAAADANQYRAVGAGVAAVSRPSIQPPPTAPASADGGGGGGTGGGSGTRPGIAPYRAAGGHHIHQSAAYAPAGTASRTGNSNTTPPLPSSKTCPGSPALSMTRRVRSKSTSTAPRTALSSIDRTSVAFRYRPLAMARRWAPHRSTSRTSKRFTPCGPPVGPRKPR